MIAWWTGRSWSSWLRCCQWFCKFSAIIFGLLSIGNDGDFSFFDQWLTQYCVFAIPSQIRSCGHIIQVDDSRLRSTKYVASRLSWGFHRAGRSGISNQVNRTYCTRTVFHFRLRGYPRCTRAKGMVIRVDTANSLLRIPCNTIECLINDNNVQQITVTAIKNYLWLGSTGTGARNTLAELGKRSSALRKNWPRSRRSGPIFGKVCKRGRTQADNWRTKFGLEKRWSHNRIAP